MLTTEQKAEHKSSRSPEAFNASIRKTTNVGANDSFFRKLFVFFIKAVWFVESPTCVKISGVGKRSEMCLQMVNGLHVMV